MRVVVVGASGNVGTSVIRSLSEESQVTSILGLSRRRPGLEVAKVEWQTADVTQSALEKLFRGADAIIHLAWLIQPGRDRALTRAVNVDGSRRVFEATAAAQVPALVYASSVGAYSPGPKDRRVDETWPTGGVASSFYSSDKAAVEAMLDAFEAAHPRVRVVRLRPGLIFKREAASEIRRLFAGPFLPGSILRPGLIPVMPKVDGLVFQAVHSDDVGDAYRLAATGNAAGAFNLAAEPVLDSARLAELFRARLVPVPRRVLRGAADLTFRLRLQPSEPGWVDHGAGGTADGHVSRTRPSRLEADADGNRRPLGPHGRDAPGSGRPHAAAGARGRRARRIRELLSGVGARRG